MDPDAYLEMSRTESTHWWFRARREIIESTIGRFGLPSDANILEVGAGTGGNLDMLSRHGSVRAMEMDKSAIAIANKKTEHRFNIVEGQCPDRIPFDEDRFDLVCMFDVLEHIEDDLSTLRVLRQRLEPNGVLFMTVPAYQWLWGGHDVHLHHYRRYTAGLLRGRLESAGWCAVRISYFNTFLLPLTVFARCLDKVRRGASSVGTAIPPKWVNASLYKIFRSEKGWLAKGNFPFGVSLLAVAKLRS